MDIRRTLPSAKHIYDQILFGEEAACALFLHLESAVSDFIDRMVSSEDAILSANIDLLEGFRLAAFMGGTGFIRDVGKTQTNTVRTSAITDRFVSVLAAIAFVRYLSVVLVRVARLYCEDAQHHDLKSMWEQVIVFYNSGCQSLARALVKRRSDVSPLLRCVIARIHLTALPIDADLHVRAFGPPSPKELPPASRLHVYGSSMVDPRERGRARPRANLQQQTGSCDRSAFQVDSVAHVVSTQLHRTRKRHAAGLSRSNPSAEGESDHQSFESDLCSVSEESGSVGLADQRHVRFLFVFRELLSSF